MCHKRWAGIGLAAAILGLTVVPALAKGASYVTIEGPGLDPPLVITDPDRVQHLAMAALEGVDATALPPAWVHQVYVVTRWIEDGSRDIPFDQVLYVPDPEGGQAFVYYVGIYNGDGPYDRKWYRATIQGDRTMTAILKEAGLAGGVAVSLRDQGTSAGRSPAFPTSLPSALEAAALGAALAAGGFVAGWALRSRRASRQETPLK